jgi:hypothetical protein
MIYVSRISYYNYLFYLSPNEDKNELTADAKASDQTKIQDYFLRRDLVQTTRKSPSSVRRPEKWTDPHNGRPIQRISSKSSLFSSMSCVKNDVALSVETF